LIKALNAAPGNSKEVVARHAACKSKQLREFRTAKGQSETPAKGKLTRNCPGQRIRATASRNNTRAWMVPASYGNWAGVQKQSLAAYGRQTAVNG